MNDLSVFRDSRIKKILSLAGMLGWQDIRQSYRRSSIGQFWITGGMAVQIASIALVFGLIFKTDLREYLPFLTSSNLIWGLIGGVLSEGCLAFIVAEAMIKQLNLSTYLHIFRVVWRGLIAFGHNLIILPLAFLIVWHGFNWNLFLFPIGLALIVINLTWMATVLALISARYRDMPPTVTSLLTVAFYVTPVMWSPSQIPSGTAHLMLGLNPFYHLLQVGRLPLLGAVPTLENYAAVVVLALVVWVVAIAAVRKFKRQVPYWV